MVKVSTTVDATVEVEVDVSLDDVIAELNSQADETDPDRWRAWLGFVSSGLRLIDTAKLREARK